MPSRPRYVEALIEDRARSGRAEVGGAPHVLPGERSRLEFGRAR
jgi:hypothetical protein